MRLPDSRALLLLASLPFCWAQTDSTPPDDAAQRLKELMKIQVDSVYTASRSVQKTTDAPASVSIVTGEDIRKFGFRTLADVLRNVTGFYVPYDRFYNYVGVRGFGRAGDFNAKVLVLIDGHRINENVYDGVYVENTFPLDMDLVERIEIIRGPGSSLYGTNAFFAVINVIPKRGRDLNRGEAVIDAGSLRTFRGRMSYGKQWSKNRELLISGTGTGSHGQDRLYFPELAGSFGDGFLRNSDRERAGNAFANLNIGDFTLQAAGASRRKYFPGLYLGQDFTDARNYGQDSRGYVDLSYNRSIDETLNLSARVYLDRYQFDGFNPYFSETGDSTVVSREFANGSWWGGELVANKRLFNRHLLTGGVDFRISPLARLVTYDEEPYVSYADTRSSLNNQGVFVQDEISILHNLRVYGGVRMDRYSTFGRTLNPRAGLVFQPTTKSALKLLHGQAFRAPNQYELNYTTGTYIPNPELQPERVKTTELVWEQYVRERFRVSAAGFVSRISDLIDQFANDENTRVQYRNSGAYLSRGLEFETESKFQNGWQLRTSYGFQRTINRNTREWQTNSPLHMGKMGLAIPLFKENMTAAFDVQYVSRRLTRPDRPWDSAKSFFVPNVTLTSKRRGGRTMDFSVSIYNFSNNRWYHPASEEYLVNLIEQDRRLFRARLTFGF